jgi:glycosyltransferase involved in cell wall biosynthesis
MNAIWLSWEDHRRSRVLANALGVPLRVFPAPKAKWLYPLLPAIRSLFVLLSLRERTVVVQNPSLVLTALTCLLKPIKGFRVVQDLHSYFFLHIERGVGLRGKVYRALSRYCIRNADVTVVTNPELKAVIEHNGGRGMVLQDAIPRFGHVNGNGMAETGGPSIVFVCTYSADEPVQEVIEAARRLNGAAQIYVTGRTPKWMTAETLPSNLHPTGFLPEQEYLRLLKNCDGVMVLTTREHTLLCGAYEGLAFRKPVILSNKAALRNYFGPEIIYVENDAASLEDGVRRLLAAKESYAIKAERLVQSLKNNWVAAFEAFQSAVAGAAPEAENDHGFPNCW